MHGYITVPRVICDAFVDTEVFQRLRNIEQTSMRWLFPGGRHDRFIHSLGVYHLARKIFTAILDNSNDAEIRDVLTTGGLREAFEIAALMHDCGHAPFSHTFEDLYNSYFDGSAHNDASDALLSVVDAETNFDLRKKGDSEKPPAPHEVMSAYVLISQFGQALKDNGVRSVSLVARMITGCAHPQPQNIREQVENILIKLLNGYVIDVDKLDYIIRDTWASGVSNFSIDIQRLVCGAKITRLGSSIGKAEFVYLPRSVGVVQTVIDARNHLYEWIYGHRVVVYYADILRRAVHDLAIALSRVGATGEKENDPMEILRRIFSTKAFGVPVCPVRGIAHLRVKSLSDGDLVFLLKEFCPDSKWWKIYSNHTPGHVALWKTGAEYRSLITRPYRVSLDNCIEAIRLKFGLHDEECFACKDMAYKLQQIVDSAVLIEMEPGKIRSLTRVVTLPKYSMVDGSVENSAFYVFVKKDCASRREEMIEFVNRLSDMELSEQEVFIQELRSKNANPAKEIARV